MRRYLCGSSSYCVRGRCRRLCETQDRKLCHKLGHRPFAIQCHKGHTVFMRVCIGNWVTSSVIDWSKYRVTNWSIIQCHIRCIAIRTTYCVTGRFLYWVTTRTPLRVPCRIQYSIPCPRTRSMCQERRVSLVASGATKTRPDNYFCHRDYFYSSSLISRDYLSL